ncbi:hypothetical protein PQQ51_10675 [Paraburkholderia xenovorans]|uniref:hypothetical protein n=1 Tax=Paraburkholderia xenovorans TaxID=36873 RepID=UPI0038BAB80D
MKALKIALIACAMSAAVAHAQTAPSSVEQQQVAQANVQRAQSFAAEKRAVVPKAKARTEECVGPMSFCNLYFGS